MFRVEVPCVTLKPSDLLNDSLVFANMKFRRPQQPTRVVALVVPPAVVWNTFLVLLRPMKQHPISVAPKEETAENAAAAVAAVVPEQMG